MRYPDEIYRKAETELNVRRLTALNALDARKEHIRQNYPKIAGWRRQINTLGVQLGRAMIANDAEACNNLLSQITETRWAMQDALIAAELPAHYLEAPFTCKVCEDKGLHEGRFCECRQKILNRLAYEMLADGSSANECSFDSFDLSFYPEQNLKAMASLLKSCRRYAADFSSKSPNLLFWGPPGLGKTHLSLAIAREVVNLGKLVMYTGAVNLVSRIVDSVMGDEDQDEYRELVYGCDLLIIDDLGVEIKTHITKSEVYNLIDERTKKSRPTIINTNLSIKDMAANYDRRVQSRLAGCYVENRFDGDDIRFQLKERKVLCPG